MGKNKLTKWFVANTNPEDEVKQKHQIFNTAQTAPRNWHPGKKEYKSRKKRVKNYIELICYTKENPTHAHTSCMFFFEHKVTIWILHAV